MKTERKPFWQRWSAAAVATLAANGSLMSSQLHSSIHFILICVWFLPFARVASRHFWFSTPSAPSIPPYHSQTLRCRNANWYLLRLTFCVSCQVDICHSLCISVVSNINFKSWQIAVKYVENWNELWVGAVGVASISNQLGKLLRGPFLITDVYVCVCVYINASWLMSYSWQAGTHATPTHTRVQ